MRSQIPKPRIKDIVERFDMSRMFGEVMGIRGKKLKVEWSDGEKPDSTFENPKDLALVRRVY